MQRSSADLPVPTLVLTVEDKCRIERVRFDALLDPVDEHGEVGLRERIVG